MSTYTGTIASVKRVKSSRLGNPAFLITFTDYQALRTQTDSSVGYEADNFKPGTLVSLKLTPAGRITAIHEVTK